MLGRFGLEDIGVRLVVDNLDGYTAGLKQADKAVGNSIAALERYQAQVNESEVALDKFGLTLDKSEGWLVSHRNMLRAVGMGFTALGVGALKLIGDVEGLTEKWGDNLTTMEKVRVGMGRFLDPFKAIFQLVTGLGPLLLVLSTRWGTHAAAMIYSTAATVAHTVAMKAFGLSAAAAAAAVRTLMIALGLITAVVTIALLIWNNAEDKKRAAVLKTTEALKAQNTEQLAAALLLRDAEEAAIIKQYDDALAYVRAYYGDVQEIDNSLMTQRQKKHDQAIALIEDELRTALDAKQKEYDAALAVIDLELSRSLAPLQKRLDMMEEQAQQEDRLRADQQDAERIAALEALIATAKTEDEVLAYKEQIAEIEEQANYRHQQEMYQDKRDAILAEMEDIRAAAEEKRKLAEEEYNAQITALQTATDEHKTILDTQLTEDLARINQYGLEYMANAKTMYDKEMELLAERIKNTKEGYATLLEMEKAYQADLLASQKSTYEQMLPYLFPPLTYISTILKNLPWDNKKPKEEQYGGTAQGGPTWVGERGRELVYMPQGAQVVPNNVTTNYNVTANYLNPQQPASLAMDLEAIRMMSRV